MSCPLFPTLLRNHAVFSRAGATARPFFASSAGRATSANKASFSSRPSSVRKSGLSPTLTTRPRLWNTPPSQIRTMKIEAIPMWSDNYAYLVVDDKSPTRDAVIIDPAHASEVGLVLKRAVEQQEILLKAIVNTHHHRDHAGGNEELRKILNLPSLPIVGGRDCAAVTKVPFDGESVAFSPNLVLRSIHTPCHTQDSICWYAEDDDGEQKVVFTGDTLFHGGCGRFFEGTAEEMHAALNEKLGRLPPETQVYPGHEYTKANAHFGLSVLPKDEAIQRLADKAAATRETVGLFTIGDERKHNVFMRVDDADVQAKTGETEGVSVMKKLREMKNNA